MTRELFKDGKTYAINGNCYYSVFHKGPCLAVDYNTIENDYPKFIEAINFFYPTEEKTKLVRLGRDIHTVYDLNKIHALINCNDNWVCCLEEVED